MTRELKIALLIGFCLVLVVSVLIADHLSAARNAKLAEASGETMPLVRDPLGAVDDLSGETPGTGITPGPLAMNDQPNYNGLGGGMGITEPGIIDLTNPNATSATDPHADAYAMVGATAVREPAITPNATNTPGGYQPYTIVQGSGSGNQPSGNQPNTLAINNTDPTIGDIVRGVGGDLVNGTIELPAAVKTDIITPTGFNSVNPEPTVFPPVATETHTVKSGDNLYKIAKAKYGSGEKWRILADANKDKISKNGNLKVGTVLVIPAAKPVTLAKAQVPPQNKPANNARDNRDTRATTPGRTAEPTFAAKADNKPAANATANTTAKKGTTYTVKSGDSLGVISQSTLGTTKRMNEILAANKGKISDADDIRVGMVLSIPAR